MANSQFAQVLNQRVRALSGDADGPRRRWQIWLQQERSNQHICFGTSTRDTCAQNACTWRGECISLRAEWKR